MCSGTISCGSATMPRGNSGKSRTTSPDIVVRVYVARTEVDDPHGDPVAAARALRRGCGKIRRMTDEPLAEAWEAQAEQWRRWARTPGLDRHFERYNWPSFLDLVPPPGRATLDLGCGEGRAGAVLRARGHRLTGVDVAPTMVRFARETGAYHEVVEADAVALPMADAAFDLVLAFMSLQDMDDAAAALREAWRVLEPGGRLVMAVVHPFASAEMGTPYFDTVRWADPIER